ncbi:MAG: glycoside hydrolase family 3 C-terminal domain-containing protein [Anaerolineae bacterium]|nr:glycoside hydrolase family 3 C-terminal domain-containing protein [Anaerolineae bacterium]
MSKTPTYTNPQRPTAERVADLLSRMTLAEKIGQMCQLDGRQNAEALLQEKHIGSFLHIIGEKTNELQKLAEQTRLGIPLIFGIDAIHGHCFWPTATVFPTQLAMACSWNPDLVEKMGQITAREASYTGMHWTFSPELDVARDLRWGRIDETFGEDPFLVGMLGRALVRGYQGQNLADPETILACPKHYAGYSCTQGGRDASEADLSQRHMRSIFLRPFHEAVKAGCATIMAGYQSIDGVPCTANHWLLTEVLKKEWGFAGFVVTDWNNIGQMYLNQKVCATLAEAVQKAVAAGNDMMMSTPAFPDIALKLAQSGALDLAQIDEACRRILRLKFELGLFDQNRYANLEKGREIIGCAEHRQAALESAYQSIVLLKNQDNLLPLANDLKRIAVIGPNADDVIAQLGDWVFLGVMESIMSGNQEKFLEALERENVVTVLEGIRQRAGAASRVDYCRGCDVIKPDTSEIAVAVELARQAEVAIVVVGDTLSQNGEVRDRANLDLSGGQQQLLQSVHATGTPLVVVLINGKPLSIPWVAEHAHAVVEAWNPGLAGGTAVAGLLFGDRNPGGKLAISFPYHVGQQPVYYNQIPGWHTHRYVDMPPEPLFAFGYGLSYTSFAYANLKLGAKELAPGQNLQVEIEVRNTGRRAGVEIVQLYLNDVYSSVTTPVKELKAFARVDLQPGEKKTILLEVPYQHLALVNQYLETVVEPGEFEVMVGGSSRDQDLLKDTFAVVA